MSGLQQRDCEREQEVAWDHQEQQDPEEEKMLVKIKIFDNEPCCGGMLVLATEG